MKDQLGNSSSKDRGTGDFQPYPFGGMSSWAQNLESLHCWRVLTLLPQHRLEEDHTLAAVMGR